jgi:hypothetical protein
VVPLGSLRLGASRSITQRCFGMVENLRTIFSDMKAPHVAGLKFAAPKLDSPREKSCQYPC